MLANKTNKPTRLAALVLKLLLLECYYAGALALRLLTVSPPTSLAATSFNSTAIKLSWRAAPTSPGSTITSYRIYRNSSTVFYVSGSTLAFTDTGLRPSTTYSYQLRAYNSLNQLSTLSSPAAVATAAAPPGVLVASSSITILPIRSPTAVSGFSPDASGVSFNWGFMQPGAYLEYSLNVPTAKAYTLTLLESSWQANPTVKVYVNGALAGSIGFLSQGSWTAYLTSDPLTVTLRTGANTLRVQDATGIGFNLAGVTLSPGETGIPVLAGGPTILPIRSPNVVSGFTGDATGVFDWGFMQPNAYVQYTLNVQVASKYTLTLTESSWDPNGGVKVFVNGTLAGSITFISQGSWTSFLISDPLVVTLRSGPNTLKIQDATGIGFNLAGVMLNPGVPPTIPKKGINAGEIMRSGSASAAAATAVVLADLGVAWVRADFAWSEMEYLGPGVYDTSGHDIGVKALVARGIQVLGIIDYTPPWANGGKHQMVPPDDAHISSFGSFAGYLARRYGPMGVHAWEIWNEPNIVDFWATGADPVMYTKLLKAAYTAIKAADRNATVITAGLAPACTCKGNLRPQDFLSGIYAAGAQGSFDAVGMHPYTYPALPTAIDGGAYWWTAMQELRAIMAQNGDSGKLIWATEYGAPTNGPPGSSFVPEATQSTMLTQSYQLARAGAWMGPLFWYCLNDYGTDTNTMENFFGMVRFDKTKKPAFGALKSAPAT